MNVEQALAKWVEYNQRIKEVQENAKPIYDNLKTLRHKKQIIETKLQKIIPPNETKTYLLNNFRLKPTIVEQSPAVTKSHIEQTIRRFFGGNERDANKLLKMIYDDRPKVEKCTIRCTTVRSKKTT